MSEWKKCPIGEVVTLRQGFAINAKSKHYMSKEETSLPLLRIADMKNGTKEVFVKEEIPQRFIAHPEDIIYTRTGNVGLVFRNNYGVMHNNCFSVTPNDADELSRDFLYYALQNKTFFDTANALARGAAQPDLPHTSFNSIEFAYPSLFVQERIAYILSRYDSLIENYQKQIKLLEEAAQRLYKEWFIDLRFPGHENTNIIDGVPEGWEKKKLCQFTGITDGTHDSPKQVEIGLPLVTGRCIVDGSIDFSQAYNISEEDVIKINKRSAVEDGDILLSNIGTIGKVCRISKSGNYAVKNMIIFKPHDAIHSCFLHRFLTDNNTQMDFLQQAAGTSQKFVSLSFIRNTLILRPSDTILNLFYNHSEKYFKYVQILQSQLRLLTEARDRLLPKLMSGEIEI